MTIPFYTRLAAQRVPVERAVGHEAAERRPEREEGRRFRHRLEAADHGPATLAFSRCAAFQISRNC